MDEDKLNPALRNALIDFFEGWELVEFLRTPTEVLVDLLEDDIIDNQHDLAEFIGFDLEDEDEDETD